MLRPPGALQPSRRNQLNAVKGCEAVKLRQNCLGSGPFWIRQTQPCAELCASLRLFRVVKGVLGRPVLSWFGSDQKRGAGCRCCRKVLAEVLKCVERVGCPAARVIEESDDETSVRELRKIRTESLTHCRTAGTVHDRAATGFVSSRAEPIYGFIGEWRYQDEVTVLCEVVEAIVNSRSIRGRFDGDTDDGRGERVAFSRQLMSAAPVESAKGEHCSNGAAKARSVLMLLPCGGTEEKPTSKLMQGNAPSDVWRNSTPNVLQNVAPVVPTSGKTPQAKRSFAL